MSKESFKPLIARDTLVVEELQVFNAVQKWIGHNDIDKQDAVNLLECIRLKEIPLTELTTTVEESERGNVFHGDNGMHLHTWEDW